MNITLKVAAVIKNKNGEKLLIKEQYDKEAGYKWNLVKGTYDDPAETIEGCIKREIEEEVGLKDLAMVGLRKVYHYGTAEKPKMLFVFELDYLGNSEVSFENNRSDEDIIEIRWLKDEVIELIPEEDLMGFYVSDSLKMRPGQVSISRI